MVDPANQVQKDSANAPGDDGVNIEYESVEQMWQYELDPEFAEITKTLKKSDHQPIGTKDDWYAGSVKYWDKQPATNNGVLGGYESVHDIDSKTSNMMILQYKELISGFETAVDFGAGIGRVSEASLMPKFKEVDLVEPSEV